MTEPREFFTQEEITSIESAIAEAEKDTSGEICVHIDSLCTKDPIKRAQEIFKIRDLHKTKFRNAVLFYLAVDSHKFAIWGDKGINKKVEEGFWDDVRDLIQENFKSGNFAIGLEKAVRLAGERLQKYFPYEDKGAINEIDNEISFHKGS